MDTIVALSSGLPAAIAIIRLSGKEALSLLKSVFKTEKEIKPRLMMYGAIELNKSKENTETANNTKAFNNNDKNKSVIKDNVMAVFFNAPNSYTGEDMVEIYTHGSRPVVNALINTFVNNGARLAEGGEFTMRAYLNNKLDLTAAEGIINLINAQTENQARAAYNLLDGKLRAKIESFQQKLIKAIAYIEADLDYPEEDVASDNKQNIKNIISGLTNEIGILKESFNQGRLIKDGVKVVLAGNVNVGKSSLINALLNKERVIVSATAGTTRDVVEESYFYKGQKFILTDTAGIRETENEIESIGVKKALKEIEKADIILSVSAADIKNGSFIDNEKDVNNVNKTGTDNDINTFNTEKINKQNKNIIYVKNKSDLEQIDLLNNKSFEKSLNNKTNIDNANLKGADLLNNSNAGNEKNGISVIKVSALKNINIDLLKEEIYKKAFSFKESAKDIIEAEIITDLRHYNCLDACVVSLKQALEDTEREDYNYITDCIAAQLRDAYNSLGQITGVLGSEKIVNEIFSSFCVGK